MSNGVKDIVKNPTLLFLTLGHRGFFNWMPDKQYLRIAFSSRMGKELNLENPSTFSEKMQWLKLYDRRPDYSLMVDKCEAKKFVAERIGEQYIIPTFGVWERFNDIDFSQLPSQFVLKCTHDSGGLVICKDKGKLDISAARRTINDCLKHNYFWGMREWPYKNVRPRIIAEKYLEEPTNHGLLDYKLMCFNSKVRCSFVCSDRFSKGGLEVTFFDRNWNVMPFERHYPSKKEGFPEPQNYGKMIQLAENLTKGIPFVRVDFYEVCGKIYFGELTFFPGSGMEEFTPEEYDYLLGSWISLPQIEK